jgi:hypothetical protein
MWPAFFSLDINTVLQGEGNRLVTYTPQTNWTTRGAFPDGIQAGDIVDIPESLGNYSVDLDPGGLDIATVGCLFVLLEEDSTPGHAVRAGHKAFAEAVDEVLNTFVDSVFPNPDVSVTDAQIEQMAGQIQGQVKGAIKDELSWIQLLYQQDDFIGFGYRILSRSDLRMLAARPFGRQGFTNRIVNSVSIFGQNYVQDFEVFGVVTAVDDDQPPGEGNAQYETYRLTVRELRTAEDAIRKVLRKLRKTASGRRELITELMRLRHEALPQAMEHLEDARIAYERSQRNLRGDAGTPPASDTPGRGRQLYAKRGSLFRESALVAEPRLVEDDER